MRFRSPSGIVAQEVAHVLIRRHRVVVRPQRAESPRHVDFVGAGRLDKVLLHLHVDQAHESRLVVLEHIHNVVLGQVSAQPCHHLSRQLVEQARVLVVADVVEIDQPAHQVVFRAFFLDNARTVRSLYC